MISRTTCLFVSSLIFFQLITPTLARALPIPPWPITITPGSNAETTLLSKNSGTTVVTGSRVGAPGQFCVYTFPTSPGASCSFTLECNLMSGNAAPTLSVLNVNSKPLIFSTTLSASTETISWTTPADWKLGLGIRVMVSAQTQPYSFQSGIYQMVDTGSGSVANVMLNWMQSNSNSSPTILAGNSSSLRFQVSGMPAPGSMPLPGTVQILNPLATAVPLWVARGYSVTGQYPVSSQYSNETRSQLLINQIVPGVQSVLLSGLGYAPTDGNSQAFQQAWSQRFNSAFDSGNLKSMHLLMSDQEFNRARALVSSLETHIALAKVALLMPDPVTAERDGVISPLQKIATDSGADEIDIIPDGSLMNRAVPYQGGLRDEPFSVAYLSASAAEGALKALPVHRTLYLPSFGNMSQDEWQALFTAWMMASSWDSYVVPALGNITPQDYSQMQIIEELLNSMPPRQSATHFGDDHVGVLLSDSAQLGYETPETDPLSWLYSLTLPLLRRGIDLNVVGLERAVSPAVLSHYKSLILSYDNQSPVGAATQQSLANWVEDGGSLILVGGDGATDGWWTSAGTPTPVQDLAKRLSLSIPQSVSGNVKLGNNNTSLTTLFSSAPTIAIVTQNCDLSKYVTNGKVGVRFSNALPSGGQPASVQQIVLRVNGTVAVSMVAGSDLESYFISADDGSRCTTGVRSLLGKENYSLEFRSIPAGAQVQLEVVYTGSLLAQVFSPITGERVKLVPVGDADGLAGKFPVIWVLNGNATSSLPANTSGLTPLFISQNGDIPLWMSKVGRGNLIRVGIASNWFSKGNRAGALLRSIVQMALVHADGKYSEHSTLIAQRGSLIAIHTLYESYTVSANTVNLFSPNLNPVMNRVIPPHSNALLYVIPSPGQTQSILSNNTVEAVLQTSQLSSLYLTGPSNVPGEVLIPAYGKALAGVNAIDRYGCPVAVQTSWENGDILVRYMASSDGVAIRIGWK